MSGMSAQCFATNILSFKAHKCSFSFALWWDMEEKSLIHLVDSKNVQYNVEGGNGECVKSHISE